MAACLRPKLSISATLEDAEGMLHELATPNRVDRTVEQGQPGFDGEAASVHVRTHFSGVKNWRGRSDTSRDDERLHRTKLVPIFEYNRKPGRYKSYELTKK